MKLLLWSKPFLGLSPSPSSSSSFNAFSPHHHTHITIHHLMIGCNASTVGAERANLSATTRLRPLMLRQLAHMRSWRLPACSSKAAPYRKGLLLEDKERTTPPPSTTANPYVVKVATKLKQIRSRRKLPTPIAQSKSDDDDEGRMIGPGSPSFRVFIEDAARNGHVDRNGENEGVKEADSASTSGAVAEKKRKKVKRERKRKRNIIKSAIAEKRREAGNAVKNLLNVKGCYHPPSAALNTH